VTCAAVGNDLAEFAAAGCGPGVDQLGDLASGAPNVLVGGRLGGSSWLLFKTVGVVLRWFESITRHTSRIGL
jgi:hypothetical protein